MSWYKGTPFLPGPSCPCPVFYFRVILPHCFTEPKIYNTWLCPNLNLEAEVQSEACWSPRWGPSHSYCGCKVDPGLSERKKAICPATLFKRCWVLSLTHYALGPASGTDQYLLWLPPESSPQTEMAVQGTTAEQQNEEFMSYKKVP